MTAVATRCLYASGLFARIVGTTTSYYHQDALGSTRAATDSAGAIIWAAQYKPFGLEYGTAGSGDGKLRFTGQWKDAATGLYYLRARMYDPAIGRFVSADPVLGSLSAPQTLNRYAYVRNDSLARPVPSAWIYSPKPIRFP